ncbi:hypothetical protein [Erythrobacter sanguineus]|jgi:hypothetical protein|uniref:Photosynthetic complex assembly protein n=1 Tax=Erythrobacter sanguineus TaxID=198312 RepID=A0A1M7SGM5_9SPHN|nr:hypothetical protein [Erythrobacter sanguineus]MCR9179916.1 hypothetical protein [Erythrobacteraceae bacterium]SHN57625.1 hypothetical protein SAMN02745193_01675 [Erythrobacter sanguineus]
MALNPLLLQFGGSLIAILALAGLARWLGLGGTPRLATDADVHRVAAEVADGFAPVAIDLDREGQAAIARDAEGRIMLIKRHGNRFAGRILGPAAQARLLTNLGPEALVVDCGEARFGTVSLDLPAAEAWAEAINRLDEPHHA